MRNSILIVNSDDYGISDAVNSAIVQGYENGCISSTTLMASMPGFGDAIERAHATPILKNTIGLHMNLTEGAPLSEPIKKVPRFCKDGRFCYDRKKAIFTMTSEEKNAVYAEISAQLKRVMDNGITPTHLDSHHHVHTEFGIINVYLAVAREFGISKVRISKNIGHVSKVKYVYKQLFNAYVKGRFGMKTTDLFCTADEYGRIMNTPLAANKNIEVMVHAMLNDKKEVVDIDKVNLEAKMKPLLAGKKISSFYDL